MSAPLNGATPHEATRADRSEFDLQLTDKSMAELLDVRAWGEVLATYANTMRMAVALTDLRGRLIETCHNPQQAWAFARGESGIPAEACPFCLAPAIPCRAVIETLQTGEVTLVHDLAGLAHVAVPLTLGKRAFGAIVAGQVFDRYPEQLSLRRVAKHFQVSAQELWRISNHQTPVSRATLLVYGKLLAVLGCAFLRERYATILDRRLTEANLRYRLMIEGATEYAFFSVNPSRVVTSWNTGAERLFGYAEKEILGKDSARLFSPESLEATLPDGALQGVERRGHVHSGGWKVRKDSTRFFAEDILASLGDEQPREFGILVHDVTERRRTESALLQSQKLESIGVLASGIAHDFNNLLTGILGGLSFVAGVLPSDHAAARVLRVAQQSSERAAALTHQLLAYAGKGQFELRQIDLSRLIQDLLPLIESSVPKIAELQLDLPEDLPLMEADPSQMEQVVMNLIINGAESIGPEGGRIRVSTGAGVGEIYLEVADSGCGMNEETKACIFDPFFTTKFTGRGLGLAAVSGIIRAHHGRLMVESALGVGTIFRVYFPSDEGRTLEQEEVELRPDSRCTGTILIVDDEDGIRRVAQTILTGDGYDVVLAENGRVGVQTFAKDPDAFTAVLLDMTMPVMGGKKALKRMRELRADLPVIISTGYSEDVAREEIGGNPGISFIQKPYTAERLSAKVREATRDVERLAFRAANK